MVRTASARTASATIRRPQSLVELATNTIRKAIIEGEFALGQPISENMLSEMYNISKTPIKLALLQLRSEGLVDIFPQKGSYVFTATPNDVVQLVEWRIVLEENALVSAFANNKTLLIKELGAAYTKMCYAYKKQSLAAYYMLDSEFHKNIIACSGNKYFMNSYGLNIHKMNAILFRFGSPPWEYKERFEEHGDLVDALRDGRASYARSLLVAHIGHLCEKSRMQDMVARWS